MVSAMNLAGISRCQIFPKKIWVYLNIEGSWSECQHVFAHHCSKLSAIYFILLNVL